MKRRTPSYAVKRTVEMFVSYSHVNAAWFAKLRPLLKFDRPANVAHAWHDQELKAGDRWDKEIRAALDRMDIFVCLLSFEFLNSGYIMDVELKRALTREKSDGVQIVPIVIYPMDMEAVCPDLHSFHRLPAWGKCWYDYVRGGGDYQDAHKEIHEGLRQAIEKVRGRK